MKLEKYNINYKFLINAMFSLLALALLMIPFLVFADDSLVACGDDCGVCDFVTLVDKVIKFLLNILILPACVIALIVAGILILTATGDPAKIQKGKDIFKYAIIGIIIAYGAWIAIDTLLGKILSSEYYYWQDFPECWEGTENPS
ncbi:MAG: hypothetical protein K9M15_01015 [Candidatus Marinimicrobia bacterium]|nr:hypothetical protein [Candidatus Neomarinimicrobiota bacterium]